MLSSRCPSTILQFLEIETIDVIRGFMYSPLESMHILDTMLNLKTSKEFIDTFQYFCEDLVTFKVPCFEILYEFSNSFIVLNLFINPNILPMGINSD